jgi:hypothetical protein
MKVQRDRNKANPHDSRLQLSRKETTMIRALAITTLALVSIGPAVLVLIDLVDRGDHKRVASSFTCGR